MAQDTEASRSFVPILAQLADDGNFKRYDLVGSFWDIKGMLLKGIVGPQFLSFSCSAYHHEGSGIAPLCAPQHCHLASPSEAQKQWIHLILLWNLQNCEPN